MAPPDGKKAVRRHGGSYHCGGEVQGSSTQKNKTGESRQEKRRTHGVMTGSLRRFVRTSLVDGAAPSVPGRTLLDVIRRSICISPWYRNSRLQASFACPVDQSSIVQSCSDLGWCMKRVGRKGLQIDHDGGFYFPGLTLDRTVAWKKSGLAPSLSRGTKPTGVRCNRHGGF